MEQPESDILIDRMLQRRAASPATFPKYKVQIGLTFAFIGFFAFLTGLRPDLFGLDRGRNIGFVQILTILGGLGVMTWSCLDVLRSFWNGSEKTLLADFGTRTVATGYVISVFTALADAFGFGTNPLPAVFLGRLQSRGLMIGIGIICLGLIMTIRFKVPSQTPEDH